MDDGVKSALGGLCVAAAVVIVGGFLMLFDAQAVADVGGFLLFLGGLAVVICLLRIGYALTRGQEPAQRIR